MSFQTYWGSAQNYQTPQFQQQVQPQIKPIVRIPYQTNLQPFFSIQDACNDSISDVSWSMTGNDSVISVCGWDSTVRILALNNESSKLASALVNDCPVTKLATTHDPLTLFFGDSYGFVYGWNAQQQGASQKIRIAQHKGVVTGLKFSADLGIILSTGTDGVIRIIDARTSKIAFSINLASKITCVDLKGDMFCVGQQNGMVGMFDLRNMRELTSSVVGKFPVTRSVPLCVSMFEDGKGCSFGTADSTIYNYFFTNSLSETSYCFKAHTSKKPTGVEMYPVNVVKYRFDGSLFTAGGDGSMGFWDVFKFKAIGMLPPIANFASITAGCYSPDGRYLAIGVGYDWSYGVYGSSLMKESGLLVKAVDPAICRS
ncbi:mitotic checkpoint protein and polyA+ RNA export protein, putative [Entamoeba invadens IP1]|uniref:Mitotic checkpoint protein and polyA+ RNA export protein, putative n=1 Tax=Entamoeba invadens IP1 TaxID=370355 RepID=A0A0A1U5E2_ENTIV|nr:mitotic checkpoint protein and polyA+ RNA export protein, putative [Entamoeba invadens IP1]ELP89447.1 mitotic checkpoint protein and polyA+ RNA export protein, putative [Entamoeba invadens IP1]|eukprot:XP_004256218.1 mitotic checkpoint protein and polyA+ RNA export protein, putative [Entamoeba invadens IP1]